MVWHSRHVSDDLSDWLSVPEVAEKLEITPSKVRQLLDERALLGSRRHGALLIPAALVTEGQLVPDLPGTITVLLDGGFSDDGALDWLLEPHEALGCSPVDALLAGRKKELRRLAQTLAV